MTGSLHDKHALGAIEAFVATSANAETVKLGFT
jgi:hypothetical protein